MGDETKRPPSGLALLEAEMARQHGDAEASLSANKAMAARIADSIRRTGGLLLIGMGASHYANRMAETSLRRLGIEAWAATAAELLQAPLPAAGRTVLFVSQSGESGEIVELLKQSFDGDHAFGLTLDGQSTLARALPCLVATGGGEIAFAATRSLFLTVALQAAVLAALEGKGGDFADVFRPVPSPSAGQALRALADKTSLVATGRAEFRGLAEANALMAMELARIPALGFEFGQFRHGPLELLSPEVGVVLLRGPGPLGLGAAGLARTVLAAGTTPVVFDCSGETPIEGAVTVACPRRDGLAAVLAMLPAQQRLIVDLAGKKVARVGEPLRSTKITGSGDEA